MIHTSLRVFIALSLMIGILIENSAKAEISLSCPRKKDKEGLSISLDEFKTLQNRLRELSQSGHLGIILNSDDKLLREFTEHNLNALVCYLFGKTSFEDLESVVQQRAKVRVKQSVKHEALSQLGNIGEELQGILKKGHATPTMIRKSASPTVPSFVVAPMINKALKNLSSVKSQVNDLQLKSCLNDLTRDQIKYITITSGGGTQSKNFVLCNQFFYQEYRSKGELNARLQAEVNVKKLSQDLQRYFVKALQFFSGNMVVPSAVYPLIAGETFGSSHHQMKYIWLATALGNIHKATYNSSEEMALFYDDFQPSNVLLAKNGEIKFIDLGGMQMRHLKEIANQVKSFLESFIKEGQDKKNFVAVYTKVFPQIKTYLD
jgi:uncharacterized protein (DUF934 family)